MLEKQTPVKNNSLTVRLNGADLWRAVRKNIVVVLGLIVGFGAIFGFVQNSKDVPMYASTATIFLTPEFDKETGNLDQQSVNTNRTLLNNAIALMSRENIMSQVSENIGGIAPNDIADTLTIQAVEGTELISITSQTPDPKLSKNIVENTVNVFIDSMKENLNLSNIEIVDRPKLNYESNPSKLGLYLFQGAGIGFLLACVYIFIRVTTDKRLKSKEEVESYLQIPVFCVLPDLEKDKK